MSDRWRWWVLGLGMFAAVFVFSEGLGQMLEVWNIGGRYAHAYVVLGIAIALGWRERDQIVKLVGPGSWAGFGLVLLGLAFNLVGRLGSVYTFQQIGLVIALIGFAMALAGHRAVRAVWLPLLLVFLLVPLPNFAQANLAATLQAPSSAIGVMLLRAWGVTVYTEGGVLHVVNGRLTSGQIRAGLEFVPLVLSVALLLAYACRVAAWRRALLVVLVVPLLVVVNGVWIFMAGALLERDETALALRVLGTKAVTVLATTVLLLLLAASLLVKVGTGTRSWRERIGLPHRRPLTSPPIAQQHAMGGSAKLSAAALIVAGLVVALPDRATTTPARTSLAEFPRVVGPWTGTTEALSTRDAAALRLDDYLLANYRDSVSPPVNFYVAWYDTQQAGRSVHSPNSCLPGEGWRVRSLEQVELPDVRVHGQALRVNRAIIEKGSQRMLAYYWFHQRGRVINNEYAMKWFLFQDALLRNRTDGGLVRLLSPLVSADEHAADDRLREFTQTVVPLLEPHLPN